MDLKQKGIQKDGFLSSTEKFIYSMRELDQTISFNPVTANNFSIELLSWTAPKWETKSRLVYWLLRWRSHFKLVHSIN